MRWLEKSDHVKADLSLTRRLADRAAATGITISPSLSASLLAYFELLHRWNRTINLTSLSEEDDEALDRLLLEPVAAARLLPPGAFRLLDIGSGGGSPAIPLKLASPGAVLTMVESRVRKAAFLREAVRLLELSETTVETARLEELVEQPGWKGTFDVISARGVRIGPEQIREIRQLIGVDGRVMVFVSSEQPALEAALGPLTLENVERLLPDRPSFLAILRPRAD
jgi:16S rRNA (guanine527-N7)-methyltransferase